LGELLPELVGVPDRVVLHLAHDVEAAVPGAHPGNGLAEHLLLGREVEIHHGLQSSSWRRHGLSSGEVGTATFASDSVQITSPTRIVRSSSTQPQPPASTDTPRPPPSTTIVSPGKIGFRILKRSRPSRPVGPVQ